MPMGDYCWSGGRAALTPTQRTILVLALLAGAARQAWSHGVRRSAVGSTGLGGGMWTTSETTHESTRASFFPGIAGSSGSDE
jgi:hypothetical protein